MSKGNSNIQSVINLFEKDYFYNGSVQTVNRIKKEINLFETKNLNFPQRFLNNLRTNFPNTNIENFTHFIDNDRCVRFLIEIDEELRFICQVSIFNFFSVYQRPRKVVDSMNEYGEIRFIDKNQSEICNIMYECANICSEDLVWLEKGTLTQLIDQFSSYIPELAYTHEIKIADVLFTTHYI